MNPSGGSLTADGRDWQDGNPALSRVFVGEWLTATYGLAQVLQVLQAFASPRIKSVTGEKKLKLLFSSFFILPRSWVNRPCKTLRRMEAPRPQHGLLSTPKARWRDGNRALKPPARAWHPAL